MESLTLQAVLGDCLGLNCLRVIAVEGMPGDAGLRLSFARTDDRIVIDMAGGLPAIYRLPGEAAGRPGDEDPGQPRDARRSGRRDPGRPVPSSLGALPGERLIGAHLADVRQLGLERVAFLVFEKRDRLGDPVPVTLVVEMLGIWGNLVLLDGPPHAGRVLARLRGDNRARDPRPLARGDHYTPPARDRIDLLIDGAEALRKRLENDPAPGSEAGWAALFLRAATGASPLTAREVVARAGTPVSAAGLVTAWQEMVEPAPGSAGICLFRPRSGMARVLTFRPRAAEGSVETFPTASEAVRRLRETGAGPAAADAAGPAERGSAAATGAGPTAEKAASAPPGPARGEHLALLQKRLAAAARLLDQLRSELERRADGPAKRRWAEALLAGAARVPRGAGEVVLPSPAGEETLTIPLDPARSAIGNAEYYFKEARKADQATARLPARIAAAAGEVRRIDEELDRLRRAPEEDPPAAEGAASRGARKRGAPAGAPGTGGSRPGTSATSGGSRAGAPASPGRPRGADQVPASMQPRRYELPGGWVILVGRSQAGNDYLTHRLADPRDLWFHAHGASGSHVVLKAPDKTAEPDRSIILTAAALAALHSRARHASKVPVIYAEKRHVRKPRGSKPGLAAVTHEKSVMVKPGEPSTGLPGAGYS